ncbi:MAG: ABC-F family ATP-binding cassette domain-containing protein [Sediminibacterium sp.]|jgi:ATP-binding cassette subfamily F protein uup|nr:ABC-F family ATP-binding cassette domain-containing protein [Sediminibacterium sp.]
MNYVSVEGLTKSYGINPLFKGINFNINEGDSIALIARNGVGKTTLLRILAGKEVPDAGTAKVHKDVHLVLFEQEPLFIETASITQNLFNQDHPVMKAISKYEMAMESDDENLITDAIMEMEENSAWDFESKVKTILTQLNINHLEQPVSKLSGGQRKRVSLAKTLIQIGFEPKHVLLLMDEPTNHLDLNMIEWLENYLSQEKVTLLLVSHDRYFLEAVTDQIWELERENLYSYKGDYENYLEKKAARIDSELASIDKAKNTFRKELEWMRKQPKARTTKSKSRQDNFYEVEAKAKQKIEESNLQLDMKMTRLGGKIIEAKKVYKSYGDLVVLNGFDYTFSKGERIGVVGKNGVGKSTFLQILQGITQPDSGKINVGETIVFGHFSQEGLVYKKDMRVIEFLKTFAENFPLASGGSLSAAQFLELFLFTPDKQYTYLSALSGGEKKRLQLLTILFKNPNFLILDEPTNDLDLPTLAVLEQFLIDFAGCVLLVSHDRYFMDKLVDHLFIFEGNGVIRDYPGNYTQFRILEKTKQNYAALSSDISKAKDFSVPAKEETTAVQAPAAAVKKSSEKMSFKEKTELENLNKFIPEMEAKKKVLTEKLNDSSLAYDKIIELSETLGKLNTQLEEAELRWLVLNEKNY